MALTDELHALADKHDFSGVVVVTRGAERLVELARGTADRTGGRPITPGTRFATASVTKGLTALTVASLIETGELRFDTTLRSLIDHELPLVDPAVTIEHLLGHTSGAGDYLDESELGDVDDYVMPVPVHTLDRPEAYLPILGGRPLHSSPGSLFAYNNGAYVILSIVVERAIGRSYYDLVQDRVLDPAGMVDTSFDRSDRPAGNTAINYLEDGRTNLLHVPVRGAGDGGVVSTARDLERLWAAMFDGRILPLPAIERLVEPRNVDHEQSRRYGLGFWIGLDRPIAMLEGMDAGISARTAHDRASATTYTVLANTSSGAWPIVEYLDTHLW